MQNIEVGGRASLTWISTARLRIEGELGLPGAAVDAVPGLLIVRVDVREPPDAAAGRVLEVRALRIQQLVVGLSGRRR